MHYLLAAGLIPGVFLLWASIHEFSHYLTVKHYVNVLESKFKLYPHVHEKLGFVWASVSWQADRPLTKEELANVSFAPRIPDLIGCAMLPLWHTMPSAILSMLWITAWSGALIDMFVGSLGIGEETDLKRAARGWDLNPWLLRAGGMVAVVASAISSLLVR